MVSGGGNLGAHEGSLLLWVLLLSVWTFAVAIFSRRMPLDAVARVLAVMGMIAFGFLLFILFTSNPFSRGLPQYPIDGRDLNPLLQDIGMIFHPPILYMGYVGFSVAFAFAIASLLAGRLDTAWRALVASWTRRHGCSSLSASCWARRGHTTNWAEAAGGSGTRWKTPRLCRGWWEPRCCTPGGDRKAGQLPRLDGAAGHRRLLPVPAGHLPGALRVLVSVHAFASDPSRGLFILVLLIVAIGGSLLLYALKGGRVRAHRWNIRCGRASRSCLATISC